MSDYQYYEFRAVDRPLTERMMEELRALSTRAEITPTSFTNVYHFGDFRGDPRKLMEKYLDAFVYVANWGTHRLILRLPAAAIDLRLAQAYAIQPAVSVWKHGAHVLVELIAQEEGGYWEEGEDRMDALLPLREELLAGDLCCLYLGWLRGVAERYDPDEENDEVEEPPLPPGLGKLSRPLKDLVEFLWLDPDLVEAAAETSLPPPDEPGPEEYAAWLGALPPAEKDRMLLRVLEDGAPGLRAELLGRFRQEQGGPPRAQPGGRTVGQLLAARQQQEERRKHREEQKRAQEKARKEREQAEARKRRLDQLAGRQAEAWREVDTLIASKLPQSYDQAVALLQDLQALAEREGQASQAAQRIRRLREEHARKRTFVERLDRAGLRG
jgi:hypothetical protein